jgi:hypothetical protein
MSNDETQPVSGSPREPGEAPETPQPPAPAPESPSAQVPTYAAPSRRPNRGGLILAGGALGIALVAGAGGFALGRLTADEGRDGGQFGRFGPRGDEHGPRGFPGNEQPPGFPGDDGSDDGGSNTPDDGATQGS